MYQLVVIDDEIRLLNGIVKNFPWTEWGFKVVNSFNNSLKALNYLRNNSVDVVLTDIYMPGMNGMELAEKLQEVQPEVNVVFISGFRDFEFAKKAIQLGVKQYVTKPICEKEISIIFEEIKKDLDQNRAKEGSPNDFFTGGNFLLKDRPISYHDKVILLTKRYIEENIDSASLAGAAEHVGLSPGYLSKLFKKKTNRSFSDYLLQVRLIYGIQLLNDVNLRVYEVSNKVGYKYQKNFSREFRRYFGITPSEYREGILPVKGLNETEKEIFY